MDRIERKKDIKVRIAKAWAVLEKMNKIWKSALQRNIKIELFRATVENGTTVRVEHMDAYCCT